MTTKALALAFGALALAGGCSSASDAPVEARASSEAVTYDTCTTSCPAGQHITRYYCNLCGGMGCFAAYDSVVCDVNAGSAFNMCGTGKFGGGNACPSGYHATYTYCDYNCFGSSSTGSCDGFNNATHCEIGSEPKLTFVANNGFNWKRGLPVTLWGSGFTPNGNLVEYYQPSTGFWTFVPENGDRSYWWNGNTTQINADVPTSLAPHTYTWVTVWTTDRTLASSSLPFTTGD